MGFIVKNPSTRSVILKKRLGGKNVKGNVKELHFNPKLSILGVLRMKRALHCIGGSAIVVGGRWAEVGSVKNWAKSLHK
jgi:hypothetical protein